jgi:DNA-binding MarR family transcriptional regulator
MKNEDSSEAVLTSLRRIVRAIELQSKRLIKSCGLTGPQLTVMKEIKKNPDKPISELSRHISLSQATVTSILDRLEQQGFVKRQRNEKDKRAVNLILTEKAENILIKDPSLLQDDFFENFEKLMDWEKSMILSSLQRLANMMSGSKENK